MKDFFKEVGDWSMTRLVTFMLVAAAIMLCGVVAVMVLNMEPTIINETVIPADTKPADTIVYLIVALLGMALSGKVAQKFAEIKELNIEKQEQSKN